MPMRVMSGRLHMQVFTLIQTHPRGFIEDTWGLSKVHHFWPAATSDWTIRGDQLTCEGNCFRKLVCILLCTFVSQRGSGENRLKYNRVFYRWINSGFPRSSGKRPVETRLMNDRFWRQLRSRVHPRPRCLECPCDHEKLSSDVHSRTNIYTHCLTLISSKGRLTIQQILFLFIGLFSLYCNPRLFMFPLPPNTAYVVITGPRGHSFD